MCGINNISDDIQTQQKLYVIHNLIIIEIFEKLFSTF